MSEGGDAGGPPAPAERLLGRYSLGRCLGAGGMGAVYEALHRDLGKRFALKLLHDAVSVGARQRFLLEARAMARILHPNSVAVFDVDVHAEVPFLVMELLEGEDLARHCGRQGPLSVQHTADVLVPVVAAVSAAHAHGIVHRDLKPSNVFLATRASGITPKVLDFGIAKASLAEPSEALTASGVLLGTPHYMSPEQAHGGMPVDVRSDQYSLGVLLYECVTGRQPLQGVGLLALIAQLLQGSFPRPRTLAPQLPLAFEQLILRSMALSPDERFASAAALGAALLPFASAEVQSAYSVELNGLELPPSAARRSALGAGDTAALGAGDTAALGTSAASWPRTVRPPLVSAPLAASIPRRPELARLAELVQSASSGAGRALFVLGEAGIGKSTLIQAALEQARRDAPECLTAIGHCQEQFSIAEPYAPFLDGLGALLAHDPGAQLRATLQLHAPLWCLQFPAHFAEAATLEQLKRATLGATRERMLREFVEAISRLARLQPLIFVLEDLHWADPASIDLLRCLCRRVARERVLLICSLRIDEAEIGNAPLRALRREVLAHDRCEELTLAAFSREHIRSYLDQLLQPNDFSGALAQCLQARTEGHALFMARLVQYLIDRGDIVSTARGWRLTRPAQELDIELPDSVRGLIQRRLELLDDEQRRVLQYASVEGDEFTTAVLARLLELPEESVQERLAPLRDVHRLVQQLGEDSPAPGCHTLRFRFSHVLYQNTLYGELVSARKRRLHREAAEAYLAQYGLRATELAARIARHFELAQELGRAIEHWLMAGDRALRAYAYREAEHFYGHSLTLVAALPEPERPRLSAVGRRKRAWAHFHQGDLGAAARDLEQALDHARELGDAQLQGEILNALAHVGIYSHASGVMEARATEAVQLAALSGCEGVGLVAQAQLAGGRLWGEPGTEQALSVVVSRARELQYEPALALGAALLGIAYYFRSEYLLTRRLVTESLRYEVELSDAHFTFVVQRLLAELDAHLGQVGRALAGGREALELAHRNSPLPQERPPTGWTSSDEAGHRSRIAQALMFLSWLHWELGDAKRGRDYALEGLAASVQLPDHAQGPLMVDTVGAHCHLLDIDRRVPSFGRELPRAVLNAEAERAFALVERWLARKSWWHWLLRLRVDVYRSQRALALGDVAAAEGHARAVLARARHYEARRFVAIAHSLLAEVEAESGRPELALTELLAAVALADQLAMPLLGWRLYAGLGRLYRLQDKPDEAREAYMCALVLVQSIAGELRDEEPRRLFLESEVVCEVRFGARQVAC